MQAHELMKTNVIKVKVQDSVRNVINKFIDHNISGLPVVNDRNEIVAYISDGDIMRFIGKHKDIIIDWMHFVTVIQGDDYKFEERVKHVLNLNVMDIAKKTVQTVEWNEEIEDVAAILGNKKIKKLPVKKNGVLAGIISRGDVIRTIFKELL